MQLLFTLVKKNKTKKIVTLVWHPVPNLDINIYIFANLFIHWQLKGLIIII